MSYMATDWAFRQNEGLSIAEKMVLLILAHHHNQENGCFPSYQTIARGARISTRSAKDQVMKLEAKGLIKIERRQEPDGSFSSNIYRLNINQPTVNHIHNHGEPHSPPTVNHIHNHGEPHSPPTVNHIHHHGEPHSPKQGIEQGSTEQGIEQYPQTPKGDFSESESLHQESFSLEAESNEPKRKAWSPTQDQIEVAAIYRRRATTRWSDKELKSWRAIQPLDKDELDLIKQFYSADIPKDNGYRRTTLSTLLNNWQGEVDKARKYLASQAAKYDWSENSDEIPF